MAGASTTSAVVSRVQAEPAAGQTPGQVHGEQLDAGGEARPDVADVETEEEAAEINQSGDVIFVGTLFLTPSRSSLLSQIILHAFMASPFSDCIVFLKLFRVL